MKHLSFVKGSLINNEKLEYLLKTIDNINPKRKISKERIEI